MSLVSAFFSWRSSQSSIKSNDFKITVDFSKELSTRWKQVGIELDAFDLKQSAFDSAAKDSEQKQTLFFELEGSKRKFVFEFGEILNYIDILCGMINKSSIPSKASSDLSVVLHEHLIHIFSVQKFVETYSSLRTDEATFKDIEGFVKSFWSNNPDGTDLRRRKADALNRAVTTRSLFKLK